MSAMESEVTATAGSSVKKVADLETATKPAEELAKEAATENDTNANSDTKSPTGVFVQASKETIDGRVIKKAKRRGIKMVRSNFKIMNARLNLA